MKKMHKIQRCIIIIPLICIAWNKKTLVGYFLWVKNPKKHRCQSSQSIPSHPTNHPSLYLCGNSRPSTMVGSHRPGSQLTNQPAVLSLADVFVLKPTMRIPMFFSTNDHPIKCFCVFFLRWFLVALPIRCFMLTIFVKSFGVFCMHTISIFIST